MRSKQARCRPIVRNFTAPATPGKNLRCRQGCKNTIPTARVNHEPTAAAAPPHEKWGATFSATRLREGKGGERERRGRRRRRTGRRLPNSSAGAACEAARATASAVTQPNCRLPSGRRLESGRRAAATGGGGIRREMERIKNELGGGRRKRETTRRRGAEISSLDISGSMAPPPPPRRPFLPSSRENFP